MTVLVQVPSPLRAYCGGQCEIEVVASTVCAVLAHLETNFPELYRSVCNETGAIREHINVFVNSQLIEKTNFERKVHPGDEVYIFQAVSGG